VVVEDVQHFVDERCCDASNSVFALHNLVDGFVVNKQTLLGVDG